jgi:hypothetical protein
VLAGRLGIPVTPRGIEELAGRGLLPVAGEFKGWTLYCTETLATLTAADAAAAEAAVAERTPLNRIEAARRLRIRQADFDLLVKAGLIIPDEGHWGKWGWIRLYLPATLDAFAARPDIDWAAVRATPRGRRSPLHVLAEPELILQALGGPPPPKVRPREGAAR